MFAGEILWSFSKCLCFVTALSILVAKVYLFVMIVDLLNSNKTVVRSLSLGFYKVEVLYISLCDLRTKALINLIIKRKQQKGLGKRDRDSL